MREKCSKRYGLSWSFRSVWDFSWWITWSLWTNCASFTSGFPSKKKKVQPMRLDLRRNEISAAWEPDSFWESTFRRWPLYHCLMIDSWDDHLLSLASTFTTHLKKISCPIGQADFSRFMPSQEAINLCERCTVFDIFRKNKRHKRFSSYHGYS